MAMELKNNMSAINNLNATQEFTRMWKPTSVSESGRALDKLKEMESLEKLNASDMARFTFLLAKMSFDDIAEAYFEACAEWACLGFVGCLEFSSAPWRAKSIKDFLFSKCHHDYREEMEDILCRVEALADDAGEQEITGLSLYGQDEEWETLALYREIQEIPRIGNYPPEPEDDTGYLRMKLCAENLGWHGGY